MAKARSQFLCQSCGYASPKWLGRCPECAGWNTLVEESTGSPAPAGALTGERPVPIAEVAADARPRIHTGIGELDRVLGGGLVPGSLVLLGGDPGIGKSTLLMQALHGIAAREGPDARILYVSGEESIEQTALRAQRLGARSPSLLVLAETRIERILDEAARAGPRVLAIDSIQTMHSTALESVAGSLSQVREAAGRLLSFAKERGVATVLVGHVTKDGGLAGPKTLEHVVDAVVHFEGEA